VSRVSRPDTLATELREIRRRLRLLEGTGVRASMAFAMAAPVSATQLAPARPVDWPGTESSEWETLLRAPAVSGGQLTLDVVSDAETTGEVRVLVGDEPSGDEITVTEDLTRHVVDVSGAGEILVQARRTDGTGAVRASAWLAG
jgi:hypothetical protein